jgi:peptide/nickel transport system permease protein
MNLPFETVFLATDVLLWAMVAVIAGYAWYCARRPHLALPWARVFQSRSAMASAVVLVAYLLVALADSIHYRPALGFVERGPQRTAPVYSTEVWSLLDVALRHLRLGNEKTYSEPLATRLFAKERIELRDGSPAGRIVRDYPRLRFGGARLRTEGERAADIARRGLAGLGVALAAWLALGALGAGRVAAARGAGFRAGWRALWRGETQLPWHAALGALGALLFVLAPLYALSFEYHMFGTDKVGQDVLYQSLKSVRTSLVIGTLSTLVMLPLGTGLGIMAGYFKGWVDDVIQYLYTTINSIPGVLLIAASVLMLQVYIDSRAELFPSALQRADLRLFALCVILGLTSWIGLARLLRGEAMKLTELEFIQAAHAFGVPEARIMSRHILPNVAHIVIIALAMEFSGLVLAEAVLSYVGVGVDPSTISFGTMINSARLEMAREPMVWWSLASAFVFMLTLVLAANLFADRVRDGFDPRVRRRGVPAASAA